MKHGLESAIDRACAGWLAAVDRRPGRILLATLILSVGLGVYAARNLGVNADPRALINPHLPFQLRQREVTERFHTLGDGFLVVIDADSPFAAGRAADALAARLAERHDLFSEVYVPGGGPFFAKNALLYLEPEQLEDLTDRLASVQPFLAELARDQSLLGISDLLRQALASERKGTGVGIDLATALDRVSTAVEATTRGRPAADPWGSALLGGAMPDEARQRVIELRGNLDYRQLLNAGPCIEAIRDAAHALGLDREQGMRVRITGEPVLNDEELAAVQKQAIRVAVVSFVLFTAAVVFALRSARTVFALAGSLLVSLVWSNAFATAAVGHLNAISAAFNVLIVGLGGEFGIHFCMRYMELASAGRSRTQALVETGSSIGSSLFSSACTTSIGLYIFLLTDFTGVAQLGLISGTGVLLSLISTFTVLPAILAVGGPAPKRQNLFVPAWVARVEHLPVRWARPIRFAAVVVGLASLTLLPRVRFDHNLLRLRDPSTESVAAFEDLLSRPGSTPWTIDVVAPSLSAAQTMAQRLAALPTVERVSTALDFVPKDQEEKREILATAAYFVPLSVTHSAEPSDAEVRAALARLADEASRVGQATSFAASARRLHDALVRFLAGPGAPGGSPEALAKLRANVVGSLPDQLDDLGPLLAPDHIELQDLPRDLRDQMLAPDGQARIEVVARDDLADSAALERFVDSVRTVAPDAAGSAVWLVEWGRVTWGAMLRALLGGTLCMAVVLVVLWRSTWDPLLAFFPLALMAVVTCATLVLLDEPFNFANVIVLPMLLGMGIDNGVHLVHRHRTDTSAVEVLSTSTARAVFYASVTTILSFGSLGLASHRAIAAIGRLLTLGVFLTLVCYVIVLPAVLEWDDRRRRREIIVRPNGRP